MSMIVEEAREILKTIYNVPEYAPRFQFVLYTIDKRTGALWFYGAYSDGVHAGLVAYAVDGCVLDMYTGRVHSKEDLI